jgi:hypothetical protein
MPGVPLWRVYADAVKNRSAVDPRGEHRRGSPWPEPGVSGARRDLTTSLVLEYRQGAIGRRAMSRALWGRAVSILIAGAIMLAVTGCGGGGGENSTAAKSAFNADQEQGTTTCGHPGATVELHGVDCELVQAMIAILDGSSRRSTLTLSDDRGKTSWICTKPSRSSYAPLGCSHGTRYFTIEFAPQ